MNQSLTIDFARPWRTHPRETVGLGLLGLATAVALAGAAGSTDRLRAAGGAARAETAAAALPTATDIRPVDDILHCDLLVPLLHNQIQKRAQ